jgi:hypothetical protein
VDVGAADEILERNEPDDALIPVHHRHAPHPVPRHLLDDLRDVGLQIDALDLLGHHVAGARVRGILAVGEQADDDVAIRDESERAAAVVDHGHDSDGLLAHELGHGEHRRLGHDLGHRRGHDVAGEEALARLVIARAALPGVAGRQGRF